jgi:hypothetical protein
LACENIKRTLIDTQAQITTFCATGAKGRSLIEECKGKLAEGYTVLNTYALEGGEEKATSLSDDNVLSSRLSYPVAVCGPADGPGEFTLETAAGEQVATNKSAGAFAAVVTIQPERMSVYNLKFSAQPSFEFCGGAVLGTK